MDRSSLYTSTKVTGRSEQLISLIFKAGLTNCVRIIENTISNHYIHVILIIIKIGFHLSHDIRFSPREKLPLMKIQVSNLQC